MPNLFNGGSGGCSTAITQATAQSRISANLVMATVAPVDEYAYSTSPGLNTHACEGRTVEQSPPPGTVVAKNSTVIVTFDIVRTPIDNEIYGLLPADATARFPVFILEQSTVDGGLCLTPTLHSTGPSERSTHCPSRRSPSFPAPTRSSTGWRRPFRPACPAYTPPP